jgi:UDP-glucuronate decarboxylase
VVSNFIVQALNNKPLTVYGEGSQTRSFCYVSDLIDGLIRMMNSEDFTGPVNLGNPVESSIKDLAELVIEHTGSASEITYMPLPQDDPVQRRPDITLAKDKLNWAPEVDLKTGIGEAIAYFEGIASEVSTVC